MTLVNFEEKTTNLGQKYEEKSKNSPLTVHFLTFSPTVAVTVCIRALSSTMFSQQYCVAPLHFRIFDP